MNLVALEYFLAIVDEGGFTAAARRCRVAQPSLSQQIRRLEEQLGYALFERTTRKVALTEAGKQLLPRARRIALEVQDTTRFFETGIRCEEGSLALGAIPTVAPYLLPEVVEGFATSFPKARLSLTEDLTEGLLSRLERRELDLAILSSPLPATVEWEVVGSEKFLVALPEGEEAADGFIAHRQLRRRPFIVLSQMHCLGKQTSDFCASSRLARSVVCETSQLATIMELVARGFGASLIPEMCVRRGSQRGVRFAQLRGGKARREITVAWPAKTERGVLAEGATAIVRDLVAT